MLRAHVFLVGISGSGKRALGSRAAQDMGLPYVDMEQQVQSMLGKSRDEIVGLLGEEFYTNAQAGVLMELIDAQPSIVATSEDTPLSKENTKLMQNHGYIVHIERPLDQLLDALRATNGNSAKSAEELVERYKSSIGFYRASADKTVHYDKGLSVALSALEELVKSL